MATPINLDTTVWGIHDVSYNGFRFPIALEASATVTPLLDDGKRAIKATKVDLTIDFYLHAGISTTDDDPEDNSLAQTVDDTFTGIRRTISQPGQPLSFSSQGFGAFHVQNPTLGIFDVDNGPRPRVVSWRPVGGNHACHVRWECTTTFIDCQFATGYPGISQLPFSINWSIDKAGLTTRTITGRFEIFNSRIPLAAGTSEQPLKFMRDVADTYREVLANFFPPLKRFQREQNFTQSEDRKFIDFTITDIEINSDNPYFSGNVETRANLRVRSSLLGGTAIGDTVGFKRWACTLSGSVDVAPGYHKLFGWHALARTFEDVFSNRKRVPEGARFRGSPGEGYEGKESEKTSGELPSAIITELELTDELYGRRIGFSVSWILTCDIGFILQATGIFQPLAIPEDEANWSRWSTSLANNRNVRGWQKLGFSPVEDVIYNICEVGGFPVTPGDTTAKPKPTRGSPKYEDSEGVTDRNHHSYSNELILHSEENTIYHVPQQELKPEKEILGTPHKDEDNYYLPSPIDDLPPASELIQPISHKTSATTNIVEMRGSSIRIGSPAVPPTLISIGGKKASKIGRDMIVRKLLGVGTSAETGRDYSIFGTGWRKFYLLDGRPTSGLVQSSGHKDLYI